ncbi:thiamine pyrophosphate-dependent enzyme [Brucepastera parasyntrophica]|uniref:thiamine pyrophosphate-dependent enzyme n=1 Tax=Brucepastera parasyntrophica TaxID=2880008 RepID=UPI00210E34D1|nr:thiamine pyrophosphate-dependent enzyme [Brucepastera parasyntrophica]ULQ58883.1 thiamine pyrophosphate-dependent enzyme [Brucepastera parasyntrophica]
MKEMVLLGDEALALGALHAGVSGCFGYPGTPSTEILEYLIENYEKNGGPLAQWCVNEKTAYETALGFSFSGKRTIVTMKHVGLNVAADPFMNSSLCGIKGGLICVVADDPSMHSSQGEQDTRFYADFAMVPLFEPVNQQEAYEMVGEAFEISEKFNVPVIMRMVTRLAHSRAVVHASDTARPENPLEKGKPEDWMLLPALARKNYNKMLDKQPALGSWADGYGRNILNINSGRKDLAIITSGLGLNYFQENLADYKALCGDAGLPSTLHISTLPVPAGLVLKLSEAAETIMVIEEGMPFIEKQLRGIIPGKNKITGKYTGLLPRAGELNPDIVRKALGLAPKASVQDSMDQSGLPGRPPQLCKGCPHTDSYTALNQTVAILNEKEGKVSTVVAADIGCYALGASAPLKAIETIVCMGASIGMARGASDAGYKYTFGVIGDSTFLHSGLTGIVDAVASNTPMTVIILDNSIVAMTGCQPTMLPSSQFEKIVAGLGVDPAHIRTLSASPAKLEENTKALVEEAEYRGLSVIIMVRECLEAFRLRRKKEALEKGPAENS